MRHEFLALLSGAPAHGYELGQALEQRFGPLLPSLNAGQIYTTLARLERDGLVQASDVVQDGRPNKRVYAITPQGRETLDAWVESPVPGVRPRNEFFMKVVLAGRTGLADPAALIARQRAEYLRSLRSVQQLAETVTEDPVASLLIEGTQLHLEADLAWLDRCEAVLVTEGGADARRRG